MCSILLRGWPWPGQKGRVHGVVWSGQPGPGCCGLAPWASFSSSVSRPLCLFVPRLRVWASRIYEIRGQVKGRSSQVKWEAKICETKEMTGQCQVKGQKSSERFSVDESEQPARRPDHTPKQAHTNVLGIKTRLKFHSLASEPAQEMGWAGTAQIRLQHWLQCHLRLIEVDSILGREG